MPSRDQFTTEIYVNGAQAQDALADLGKQLDKLKNQYANLNKNSKNYESRERELAKQIQATEKAIATAEKGTESYGRAMENLSKRSINNLIKLQRQLNSEIKKLDPNDAEFKKLSENYQRVTQRIKALKEAQEGISAGGGGIFKRAGSWLSNYYGAFVIGYQAIKRVAQGFMEAYKTISNFEQANANLASILGATSDQMEVLEKAAIQLGSSTRYSASQVTGLQTELAKLGFTVKEITDMSPAVLNFAGSVGTDLASAASLAGVALRSFNLQSDQTEDALGTMAVACNKSALSFEYLQNSFSTIAPVAKTYGLSLKDTIALLGTLANAGFDASSAATATRNILLNLSDTNGKLAKALGGSVHSFEDIMAAMKKLRDQGVDLNTTLELTDKRSVAAFNTFLDGAESAMELRGELEDVNGKLQEMAEQRANTVEGAIDGMKSAWEGLVLSFRKSTGTFAKVFKFLTDGINGIRDLIDPEGSIEERTAKMYSEMFRNIGNEFISIEETRERAWAKYQELEKSIREGGGGVVYKKHALEGLKKAYNEVMPELTEMAKAANEKVLDLNTQYMQKEQEILKQQAKLTENGLNQSNKAAYDKLQEQLEANRKAWNQAIGDATRFKEKMEDVVSGDTTTTTNGSGGGGGGSGDGGGDAAQKKAFDARIKAIQQQYKVEERELKLSLLRQEIDQAEYESRLYAAKADYFRQKIDAARQYCQDETEIMNEFYDWQIQTIEKSNKQQQDILDALAKADRARKKKEEEERLQEMQNLGKRLATEQEILENDLARVRERIGEDSWKEELAFEMWKLEELHNQGLVSERDYQQARLKIRMEYAQKAADGAVQIAEYASDFVSQLKEMESVRLEAEYQKQLTAAGDNAEKREQIEAEYEEKKLDLQKKYADVEMAINIAKTIASGAVAAIRAYAEGGPYAGVVLAALIAATTVAEVATIVAQRNAIKNTSANSSSSSSSVETGERTMTGYSEGGYTGGGHGTMSVLSRPERRRKRHSGWRPSDDNVAGVVHEGEWVAPAWMVRENPAVFADLEQYRVTLGRSRIVQTPTGFAEGGYTGNARKNTPQAVQTLTAADIEDAVGRGIVKAMQEGKFYGIVQYGDILIAKDIHENFKKQTTR